MMNATEVGFTEEEFMQQVCEFRKLMGDKTFWAKSSDQREIAQKALGHAYLFLDKAADIERCAAVLEATLGEYQRRELMIIRIGGNIGA